MLKKNYKKKRKVLKINKKRLIISSFIVIFIGFKLFNIIFSNEDVNVRMLSPKDETNFIQKDKKDDKKKVVIDIGHGGNDDGASNLVSGSVEKDVTLEIGRMVIEKLKRDKSIEVIATRTKDEFISLENINRIERENNADILVSLHCNATEPELSDIKGIETFYWRDDDGKSMKLAEKIHGGIMSTVEAEDRGVKREEYKILRESECPSVLIETGFLTNGEEEKNLLSNSYQAKLAEGIVKGIQEYFKS